MIARLALTWGYALIIATAILTACDAVITDKGVLGCKPCSIDNCKNETNCLLGSTMDLCNCCTKCFRINGQTCGGTGYIVGRCGKGLKCNLAYATFKNPVGYCVPVLNPVQKPLTRRPVFATTLHDWVNLDQQSGVPRHDIPGVPINSVAENNPRIEQKSPENNDKFFVHSTGSWNMEIVNDHDTPRVPLRPKNATQNTTQTSNQKRQRTVNKASADDFISDISPAVIFVAVTGGVFLCLVGLLFLSTSHRSLQN